MLIKEKIELRFIEAQIEYLKNSGNVKLKKETREHYTVYKITECNVNVQQKLLQIFFSNEKDLGLSVFFATLMYLENNKAFIKGLKRPLLPVCWIEQPGRQTTFNLTFILPRITTDMSVYKEFVTHEVGMISEKTI